ncbi:50S ribosomal protein L11 methyltransferase [Desulfurispira natronophila]|uniref:Ribosomal protein L11 methyltransferase n=1 Tax=Desulfurispira natronophila TaxID=682562 RepID=A0A7W7Y2X5_9BACT|nr:50S ribosomal protein L11 methyltransferase [Desulfurispira natronophila]MBB5021115.1 ribosomal protein L11 methyltransferase [Desulfurispira natronophila]
MAATVELTIHLTQQADVVEELEAWLGAWGAQAFLSKELDEIAEKDQQKLRAYFDPADYEEHRQEIDQLLCRYGATAQKALIQPQDWNSAWKAYFSPLDIGKRCLRIQPAWIPMEAGEDEQYRGVITIDPGMAFGTGQHPTTALCLEVLCQLLAADSSQRSVLDVGTGSGILAMGARKLGAAPVVAFDNDPQCLEICQVNATENSVADIDFRTATIDEFHGEFDIVVANIIAGVHLELMSHYRRLAPKVLVLSGILREREMDIRTALLDYGFTAIAGSYQGEWCCLQASPGKAG